MLLNKIATQGQYRVSSRKTQPLRFTVRIIRNSYCGQNVE